MNTMSNSANAIEIFANPASAYDYGFDEAEALREMRSPLRGQFFETEADGEHAASLIESMAPKGLQSRVLDISSRRSMMPVYLRKKGFSEVIALTEGIEHSLQLMIRDPDDPMFDVQVETGAREKIEQAHLKNIKRQVDLVLFMANRFNMIGPRENRKKAIGNVAKLLTKKGVMVFDLIDPLRYTTGISDQWHENENCYQLMKGAFNPVILQHTVELTIISKFACRVSKSLEKVYSVVFEELQESLNEHGLEVVGGLGDYRGGFLTPWSSKFIVVARKAVQSKRP